MYSIIIIYDWLIQKGPENVFHHFSVGYTVGFLASSPFQITRTLPKPTFFHEVMASRVSWLIIFFCPHRVPLLSRKSFLKFFWAKIPVRPSRDNGVTGRVVLENSTYVHCFPLV